MKLFRVLFLVLFISLLTIFPIHAQLNEAAFEKLVHQEMSRFHKVNQNRNSSNSANYDIHYHRLSIKVPLPDSGYIEGNIITHFTAKENLDFLQMDCSDNLSVDSIFYKNQSISFSHESDILSIQFPVQLNNGDIDSIQVYYHGKPLTTGLGSFETRNRNNTPLIWTLSQPYGAKEWWPCKQTLNDKIDSVDIVITAPSDLQAIANGLLIDTTTTNGFTTTHWRHGYPIPAYLIAFALSKYTYFEYEVELKEGKLPITNYIFPDVADFYTQASQDANYMIQFLDSLFTPYPFMREKYGHVMMAEDKGGMEHTTISFMSTFNFDLTAHELAHQWFGNYITCGSWEDIWLNEGFATFVTGLCHERFGGNGIFVFWKGILRDVITREPDGAIAFSDTNNIGRIFSGRLTYRKGAYFLHMLRKLMGDDLFFKAVNEYLSDPELAYGFSSTEKFKQYLYANYSKEVIDEMFADWFYGEGYPSYKVGWDQFDNNVIVSIHQLQSHSSVDFFEMPVELLLKGINGEERLVVLDYQVNDQSFEFQVDFEISEVTFDPEINVLSADNYVIRTSVADQLRVFPSPANETIKFEWFHPDVIITKVVILNLMGQQLVEVDNLTIDQTTTVNISSLAPGNYILKAESNRGAQTRTFTVQ